MEPAVAQMGQALLALWWPFCRVLAMLAAAPVIGDMSVPMRVRVLLALVLAVVLLPMAQPAAFIDPFSLAGVVATLEQAVIGLVIGLAFHLTMSVVLVLGYVVSSQMGLAMALMNDPINGNSSDVVSTLLSLMFILVFFAVDGHLMLVTVVAASLQAWPVGQGWAQLTLQTLAYNVAWVFSAAMLLAIPMVFAMFVVQLGFGFLNRVAPSLNLFSLGFALVTLFGLFLLSHVVRVVPGHYLRMGTQVLDMLRQQMER